MLDREDILKFPISNQVSEVKAHPRPSLRNIFGGFIKRDNVVAE